MARSDAKLKTLPEEIQAEMWRLRKTPVGEDGQPVEPSKGSAMSQGEVREWLEDVHSVSTSSGAFSEWERWYQLQRELRAAKTDAEQIVNFLTENRPEMSSEEVMEWGQLMFSMRALKSQDGKEFLGFANLAEKQAARRQEKEKMDLAQKSKIEAGLDELAKKIKGNKEALALYKQIKELIAEA